MISRGVELLDADVYKDKNITLLLGHIHRSQIYKKGNITVVYSGSTTYMDAGDLGMAKSYIVFTKEGEINFESFTSIRRFIKYIIPERTDPLIFLSEKRIPKNSVIFIEYNSPKIDRTELYKIIKSKECIVGNIVQVKEKQEVNLINSMVQDKNPYNIFYNYTDTYSKEKTINIELIKAVKKLGKEKIEMQLGK